MRGVLRKFAAVTAMVSALSLSAPQAAFAGYAVADYVPPGSCASEAAQVRATTSSSEVEKEIADTLAAPYVYRYDIAGMAQSPREMRASARMFASAAASDQARGSRYDAARAQLRACAYQTAAANLDILIGRLAPKGLAHHVTGADCVREQEAYAAAYDEETRGYSPRPPEGTGREMAAGFVEGVAYNHVLYGGGSGMTPDVYAAIGKLNTATGMKKFDAGYALSACLYGLAGQRLGNAPARVASNTPPTPAAPPEPADPCVGDALAAMNRDVTDVEARLERFMNESPYVKGDGQKPATPILVVTIWALQQNIAALKKHCPASPKTRDRILDLESSLKHAQEACDQIQSGGAKCGAVEPEKVV